MHIVMIMLTSSAKLGTSILSGALRNPVCRRMFIHGKRGQSYLEYSIVITVIAGALFAMSTYMKRGIQALTFTVSDQIGNQGASDQRFDDRGHLVNSFTTTRTDSKKSEVNYGIYQFNETTTTDSETVIDLGFTSNLKE